MSADRRIAIPGLFPVCRKCPSMAPRNSNSSTRGAMTAMAMMPNTLRLIPMNVSSTRLGSSMNSLATLQMNMAAIMKGILNKMVFAGTSVQLVLLN